VEWDRLLSATRLCREREKLISRPGRSEFESDVGRISFSGAFRRLARKTQVHPLAPNDHVHTRLTHTLEVAYVGRALGKELGNQIANDLPSGVTPDDLGTIVQAACLAHDLGNPPFGHAGEVAMAHWFEFKGRSIIKGLSDGDKSDIMGVEGNAQGFRIVAQTENHLFKGGLHLTYATLGAFHKYPWTNRNKDSLKFGSFRSEEAILDRIGEKLGLVENSTHRWCRHPLAHLVEAADDICYSIIDLEDAVELRILSFDEVADFFLGAFDEKEQARIRKSLMPGDSHRINLARLRSFVFDKAISGAIEAYRRGYDEIMMGRFDENVFNLLDPIDPRVKLVFGAKSLGRKKVYVDTKKVEMEIGCYSTFDSLLTEFCSAAMKQAKVLGGKTNANLSWKETQILQLLGDHTPKSENAPPGGWTSYQCLRRVIDFVSGMTDNYAVYVSRQFQGVGFAGTQRP
jgi:dGTPase